MTNKDSKTTPRFFFQSDLEYMYTTIKKIKTKSEDRE